MAKTPVTNKQSGQDELPLVAEAPDRYSPLLLVTGPVTGLSGEARDLVDARTRGVERSIARASSESAEPYEVRVHIPVEHSAPWKDELPPFEVRARLRRMFVDDVDGLILVAVENGSLGCGTELSWACKLGIPTAVFYRAGADISRHVLAAAEIYQVETLHFNDTRHLEELTGQWLARHRSRIFEGRVRRRRRREAIGPMYRAIRDAWKVATAERRAEILDVLALSRARVREALDDPSEMAAEAAGELLLLAAELGVGGQPPAELRTVPTPAFGAAVLSAEEWAACRRAATNNGWNAREGIETVQHAVEMLASGEVRRLPLGSEEIWQRLHDERPPRLD